MVSNPGVDLTQKTTPARKEALVLGQVMTAFLNNLRAEQVKPLLQAAGVASIDPNEWYPQGVFVQIYKKLEQMAQGVDTIIAIGARTVDALEFPPEATNVEDALNALPTMYHAIHRNIPPDEGWEITVVSEREIDVRFNSPYSDYAAYGYIYTIAQRFSPPDQTVMVKPEIWKQGEPALFRVLFAPR